VAEPEGKGSGFNRAVQTLRRMVPPEAFERMAATLPEDTVALIRRPPLSLAWIPTRHFTTMLRAAEAQLFGGDEQQLADWGRQAVLGDLRTIYKMFVRFLSPQWVIERGARLWETYVRNQGHVEAMPVGDDACEVRYAGLPADLVSAGYWAYQRGALRGVMEATGMKQIDVELLEGGGQASHARFRVRWRG
jgi:hypothetical protein